MAKNVSVSMMLLASAVVLSALFAAQPADAFKVCGYYCGPNWCADNVISEEQCVATGVWGSPSDGGCADSCCRVHDYCCGEGSNRPACNTAIVGCLQSSQCYLSLCGAAVWTAMKVVSGWCCGSQCPTAHLAEMPNIRDALVGNKYCFAREASHPSRVLEVAPGLPVFQFNKDSFVLLPPTDNSAPYFTVTAPETYFVDNTTNEVVLGGPKRLVSGGLLDVRPEVWATEVTRAVLAAPPLRMFEKHVPTTELESIKSVNPSIVYLPQYNQLSIVTSNGDQKIMIAC